MIPTPALFAPYLVSFTDNNVHHLVLHQLVNISQCIISD